MTSALAVLVVELSTSESVLSHSALLQLKAKSSFWITYYIGQNKRADIWGMEGNTFFKTLLAARLVSA